MGAKKLKTKTFKRGKEYFKFENSQYQDSDLIFHCIDGPVEAYQIQLLAQSLYLKKLFFEKFSFEFEYKG